MNTEKVDIVTTGEIRQVHIQVRKRKCVSIVQEY